MTNTTPLPDTHSRRSPRAAVILLLFLTAALATACATSGTVGKTGATPASEAGVGAAIRPGTIRMVYKNELFNGPSEVRIRHRQALEALNAGDYATAASLFEETLANRPAHPDATYYLGLTRIYQGQREAGFELLKSYRDPAHFRITRWVRKMAAFLEEQEDVTPDTVHRTLNRYRTDAYNRELNDTRDTRTWD